MKFDNSYVTIDLDGIAANFQAISQKAGVPVMAVVKADAYGHGAVSVARRLQGQCAFFGVSSMLEALELRDEGIQNPILVLGHIQPEAFAEAIRQGIRPSIFSLEDGKHLSEVALQLGMEAPFHLAVDTGMSRIGFQVTQEDADICKALCSLPGITAEGLFSHFATADCRDLTRAKLQAEKFEEFRQMLKNRGAAVKFCHMDNSAGIMNFSRHYDLVRAGIVLYGLYPSSQVDPKDLQITPVLRWCSRVTHVKTLEAGREVSYGGEFVTTKPTVVATVSVGYADGYRRALSGKFYVLIRGQKAPILGRICMDQMMVDVTDIPNVTVGDTVVLVGTDGEETITLEAISAAAGTINYEFACGIGRRVPRYYLQGGQVVEQTNCLLDKQ